MIGALFVAAALAAPAAASSAHGAQHKAMLKPRGDHGKKPGCALSPAAIVLPLVKGLLIDNDPSVIDTYISDDFINHNPNGAGGIANKEALAGFASPDIEYRAGLIVVEDDKVFMQGRISGAGPSPQIVVDAYRVDGDKIVEHWDVLQDEVPAAETAGPPMFEEVPGALDNYAPCYTPQDTSDDTATVLAFIKGAFVDGEVAAVETYIDEGYIQHNPDIPNGRAQLLGFVQNPTESEGMTAEVGQIASQDGLVFVHTRLSGDAVGPVAMIAYDIYRVKNGVIMEHWDVLQPEVTDTVSGEPMFTPDPSLFASVA